LGEEVAMLVYPVPIEVTRARIQLLAEQTAKAPPRIISDAVLDVFAAKNQAERENIVDRKV
jgi:predicted transcriptional regulator